VTTPDSATRVRATVYHPIGHTTFTTTEDHLAALLQELTDPNRVVILADPNGEVLHVPSRQITAVRVHSRSES
jgi:hypothetical protein